MFRVTAVYYYQGQATSLLLVEHPVSVYFIYIYIYIYILLLLFNNRVIIEAELIETIAVYRSDSPKTYNYKYTHVSRTRDGGIRHVINVLSIT